MKSFSILCFILFFSINSFSQVPLDGLIGFYQMDGNGDDSSDLSNDGMLTLNVSTTEDRFGNSDGALSFEGGAIDLGVNSDFMVTTEVTVCCWVKAEEINDWGTVISRWQDFNTGGYYLGINPDSEKMRFNVLLDNPVESDVLDLEVWNHFVGVYDGTSARIYQNGTLVSSTNQILEIGDSQSTMLIGGQSGPSGPFFGVLDDAIIYNRALSEDEVLQVYNNVPSSIFESEFDDFILYPNPASDRLFFNYTFGPNDHYEMINLSGKTVLEGRLENSNLDISGVANGIYFMQMNINGHLISRKMVIQ